MNVTHFKLGDPRNRRVVFTATDEQIKYYPVGKRMRVDANITNVGKIEGIIIKTQREKNDRHWKVTVECPPVEVTFTHFAIRDGETIDLQYEGPRDTTFGHDSYIKPSLKVVTFHVPERYFSGFEALFAHNQMVHLVLQGQGTQVSGYVYQLDPRRGRVSVHVVSNTERRDYHAESLAKSQLVQMSKNLDIPYHILTADPTYGKPVLHDAYATIKDCDEYMEQTLEQKRRLKELITSPWITPNVGYANGVLRRGVMSFAINNLKETDDMKIFDAVVVKVDDKGTPTEIAKVVSPFLAKDEAAAKTAVTVDYAAENKIAGKDLTGISVLVRPFQVGY